MTPQEQAQLDRIEQKLDRLLEFFGVEGSKRLPSELKREAMATVLKFQTKRNKIKGHEREDKIGK